MKKKSPTMSKLHSLIKNTKEILGINFHKLPMLQILKPNFLSCTEIQYHTVLLRYQAEVEETVISCGYGDRCVIHRQPWPPQYHHLFSSSSTFGKMFLMNFLTPEIAFHSSRVRKFRVAHRNSRISRAGELQLI